MDGRPGGAKVQGGDRNLSVVRGSWNSQGGRRRRQPLPRPHKLTVRLSDAELDQVDAAAGRVGMSRASWLVGAALAEVTSSPGCSARSNATDRCHTDVEDIERLAHTAAEITAALDLAISRRCHTLETSTARPLRADLRVVIAVLERTCCRIVRGGLRGGYPSS